MNKSTPPSGFTYIELMVVLAMLGVVVVAFTAYIASSLSTWRIVREQVVIQDNMRKAMEPIVSSIREMSSSENGSFAIEVATENEFIFYSDIDDDNQNERMRIFYDTNEIRQGIIDPSGNPATYPVENETVSTIASSVFLDGDLFSYYGETYTGPEDPLMFPIEETDVHLIHVHFLIDNDQGAPPPPAEMTFQVTPRNLKVYTNAG